MIGSLMRFLSGSTDEEEIAPVHQSMKVAERSSSVKRGSVDQNCNTNTSKETSTEREMRGSQSMMHVTADGLTSLPLVEFEDLDPPRFSARSRLPAVMLQRSQISVWSILKQSIGKELSKITMPVVFNEPLSFIQRLSEYMEYSHLLQKASDANDPVKRMEYVAAFAVSALASNWERLGKPFNPLLGETYELDRLEDLGFRIVCEQVSHHPPVSAFHADSPLFRFSGSIHPKLKFWGRSVEIQPKGTVTLELLKHNEVYTWTNVSCSVHNLMMGKLWIEQHGVMEIVGHQTNLKCVLNFKPTSSWFGTETNHIEGHILDKSKNRLRALYGVWTDFLASCDVSTFDSLFATWGREHKTHASRAHTKEPLTASHRATSLPVSDDDDNSAHTSKDSGKSHHNNMPPPDQGKMSNLVPVLPESEMLWKVIPRPSVSEQYYQFTLFAMMLNEWDPVKHADLPPTDCRRRPDIRWMEEGDIDQAAFEKNRLEEKQRAARAQMKKSKKDFSPIWFKQTSHRQTKEEVWVATGDYWARDWSKCSDIF